MNKVLKQIQDLARKNNMDIEDLVSSINEAKSEEDELLLRKNAEQNRHLVGKYYVSETKQSSSMFPKMKQFYHVLTNRSSSEYMVECLTFKEHPAYWFEYQIHKKDFPGDGYLGEYEFESFETMGISAKDLETMTEISKEEFDKAAKNYLEELLDLNWYTDHYRFGGKLPTDLDWKREKGEQINLITLKNKYRIKILWDDEGKVYVATSDDVPGLVLEDSSYGMLIDEVEVTIEELIN